MSKNMKKPRMFSTGENLEQRKGLFGIRGGWESASTAERVEAERRVASDRAAGTSSTSINPLNNRIS